MAAGIILHSSPKSSLKISLCIGLIFVHGLIPSIVCERGLAPPAIRDVSKLLRKQYPNPMTHPTLCRPQQETPSPSKLCDPFNMLPNETAKELDGHLDANARTCMCAVDGSFEKCNFFAVVSMQREIDSKENFTREEMDEGLQGFASYFLETWKFNGCSADVIFVISVKDNMISEAVSSKVQDLIEKGSCRNAIKHVKQRLIGLDAEHFIANINPVITSYSFILSTDHPCHVTSAMTSEPNMTAVTAAGRVRKYTVTRKSNSGTTVSLWYLTFTFVCMSRSFI